jgi:hypothetical protein
MSRRLDIIDATVQREYRIFERNGDVVAHVGYQLETTQGDIIQRSREVVLTGAARTRAVTLFADIRSSIITQEGI